MLENDSSETRASVNSVQPSAAHYTNKQIKNKNIHSIPSPINQEKPKWSNKETNKLNGNPKFQDYLNLQNLVGGWGSKGPDQDQEYSYN